MTTDEMTRKAYRAMKKDLSKTVRDDDAAFRRVKQSKDYQDLKRQLAKELGL